VASAIYAGVLAFCEGSWPRWGGMAVNQGWASRDTGGNPAGAEASTGEGGAFVLGELVEEIASTGETARL